MSHESHPTTPNPERPVYVPTGGEGQFANTLDANEVHSSLGKPINVVGGDLSAKSIAVRHRLGDALERTGTVEESVARSSHLRSQRRRQEHDRNRTIKGAGLAFLGAVALGISSPVAQETRAIGANVLGGVESVAKTVGSVFSIGNQTVDPDQLRIQRNVDKVEQQNDSVAAAQAEGVNPKFEPPQFELPPENPQP